VWHPSRRACPFWAFVFSQGWWVRLERKKWARFRHKVPVLEAQYAHGMIDEETLAQAVASMIGHVGHADSLTARRQVFASSLFLG